MLGRAAGSARHALLARGAAGGSGTPDVEAVVIGAGVVGLAVSRELARRGVEVLALDAGTAAGTETSARSSEVIHAGIYYPQGSLKAQLCVEGRQALYAFCQAHGVPYQRLGKLVVATSDSQLPALRALQAAAAANGVADLQWLSGAEARGLEPALSAAAALLSPSTGIVDSHRLMVELQRQLEEAGGALATRSRVVAGSVGGGGLKRLVVEDVGSGGETAVTARLVVNAAGLHAQRVSSLLEGLPPSSVPPLHLAKGSYFSLSGPSPFSRLVYPLPEPGGLGVHSTLDLAGAARFGPDVEWLPPGTDPAALPYRVDPARADAFYPSIRRYYPGLPDGSLQPAYSGVRPKVSGPGERAGDFVVSGAEAHGVPGLVALYGIESPGITASLAIASRVAAALGLPPG